MNEFLSAASTDPQRKPIKISNQSSNMHDLKYLIHLNTKGRKYVFSANARSDHIMWMQGFSAYFQIKEIYEQFVGRPT